MQNIKYSISLIAFISVLQVTGSLTPAAYAADAETPAQTLTLQSKEAFVNNLAQTVLVVLRDPSQSFSHKQSQLQTIFANVVDVNWIARFVLGKTWNTATTEQRDQYTSLYKVYLTNSYVSNFDEDSQKNIRSIKILGLNEEQDHAFTVHTEVVTDTDNVKVDYLISERPEGYKIIDISIEGISLLSTHHSEFGELAAAGGMDGIISKLQQMVNSGNTIKVSMK